MTINEVDAPFCLTLTYSQVYTLERAVKKHGDDELRHQWNHQRHLWQARLQLRINKLRELGNLPAIATDDDLPPHPAE